MIGKIIADRWGWTEKWFEQTNTIDSVLKIKSLKIVDKTNKCKNTNGTYTLYSDRKEIVLTPQEWNMYNKIIDQINYKVH